MVTFLLFVATEKYRESKITKSSVANSSLMACCVPIINEEPKLLVKKTAESNKSWREPFRNFHKKDPQQKNNN